MPNPMTLWNEIPELDGIELELERAMRELPATDHLPELTNEEWDAFVEEHLVVIPQVIRYDYPEE